MCVNKRKKYKLVHRLVAEAFIPNQYKKKEVNHIDGNKFNNCVNNLEWVTTKENNIHAIESGLRKKIRGKENKNSKIILQLDKNTNEIINYYYGAGEIERLKGYDPSSITKCCRKRKNYKTAYGYKWEYKEKFCNG